MNHAEALLMEAEADLYAALNSPRHPTYNSYAETLTFLDNEADHNFRCALHNSLITHAHSLLAMANLLEAIAKSHNVPLNC